MIRDQPGQGVFQSFALGLAPWLESGRLVQVLPDWSDERFPLYAYHRTRRHTPAKVEAFLAFAGEGGGKNMRSNPHALHYLNKSSSKRQADLKMALLNIL